MADESYFIQLLQHREIRPTTARLQILHQMIRGDEAVSLPDLERYLPHLDKSTISRTLTLFLLHRLVHAVDDGSGALKYAVCSTSCDCTVEEEHTHFSCTACHRTFCLKHLQVPVVNLPKGFRLQSINYVLKGLCPACASSSIDKTISINTTKTTQ